MANNETTVAREIARANAEADSYIINTKDVGAGAGAMLAMAMAFSAWWSRHKNRNVKVDKAEGDFYQNVSAENTRLVERISDLEKSRESCKDEINVLNGELVTLRAQVMQINVLEMENVHLRERLNDKDKDIEKKNTQIEEMIRALMAKDNYIMELTQRVHNLELRLSADEQKFCRDCPRMSGAIGQ